MPRITAGARPLTRGWQPGHFLSCGHEPGPGGVPRGPLLAMTLLGLAACASSPSVAEREPYIRCLAAFVAAHQSAGLPVRLSASSDDAFCGRQERAYRLAVVQRATVPEPGRSQTADRAVQQIWREFE